MLAPQKESIFGCSCRLWLLSWRRARVFARSCSLLSKYLPISWKQRKEQSHAQCHVTHRIRIFDKISEHVKVAKSVDIAVPELAVTLCRPFLLNNFDTAHFELFIEILACRWLTLHPFQIGNNYLGNFFSNFNAFRCLFCRLNEALSKLEE